MRSLNELIGIPFKLNHKDLSGCDCRGIIWLYYKYVKNIVIPFTDGKNIFFRNKRKDYERMIAVLKTFTIPITFSELQEGDIVLLDGLKHIGTLGVCIDKYQVLHMDRVVGSCLTKIKYLKDLFLAAYRPL
jgi:hypothetical protein